MNITESNGASGPAPVALRFEVTLVAVTDVDRAKAFYEGLGWRLDADFPLGGHDRIVQFTPPGSPASVQFGTGLTDMAPGSSEGLYLIVDDIEAARADLPGRVGLGDSAALAELLRETSIRHGSFEAVTPPHDWWDWYAAYMDARERGIGPDEAADAANRYMAEVKGIVPTQA